jgi:hypothetical protein
MRHASMPRALFATDKLHQAAVASNYKMRRNLHIANLCEVGVGIPVKLVGKKRFYLVATIDAGRQTDGVDDK